MPLSVKEKGEDSGRGAMEKGDRQIIVD